MLNAIFSDDMMLQCDSPVKVWGVDAPGQEISVELASDATKTTTKTTTGDDGKWLAILPPLTSGQTCEMRVNGSELQIVKNILIGDIWLCSGQSNMQFELKNADNAASEIASADFPEIRFFNVPLNASIQKQDKVEGKWEICTPETAGRITAVGYFFGRDIHQSQGRPVGLLHSSWGGTRVEAWMSRSALVSFDFMREEIEKYETYTNNKSEYEQRLKEYDESIPIDPENRGHPKGYASPSHDASNWATIEVPGFWTNQGLQFNGVLWYRTSVVLPKEWEGEECVLHLGACDKSDQTYFNNEKIGGISIEEDPQAWSVERVYTIPANIVKPGDNTIATRVFSNVHGGGIIAQPEEILISLKNHPEKSIPLAGKWQYKVEYDFGLITPPALPFGDGNANSPYILFDSMINPLLNFAIKGAIWYQGESNAVNHQHYKKLFSTMIEDWRERWGLGAFPFYLVQLASYIAGTDEEDISPWGEIRNAQEGALELENTGMAVTIDVGDPVDIHPTNKQDVGKRLALAARAKTYGESVEYSGPILDQVKISKTEIRISFTHANGLKTSNDNNIVSGIKIKTSTDALDANAIVVDNQIVIKGDDFSNVTTVTYAYGDCPECDLYNESNLPARPFLYRVYN